MDGGPAVGAPRKEVQVLTGTRSSPGGSQAQRVRQTASHIDPTKNADLGILLDNIRAKVDQETSSQTDSPPQERTHLHSDNSEEGGTRFHKDRATK